ncbi:hypothetical protein [Haloactinomyces albus]|uniref:Uncharacterized protein n=1 Tax=Haloactinomyces albus TaxID=1352928 RepID=A0AAE4CKJ8_9ACTN|nr:hypothetical protein [Haloactinomyces albus]MDR7300819.1 hypothetical protein [Haloactinomyces albus]
MPIRTHRGRAAVYRRLWGWPLRSPKHLIAAVLGLIVIASAVGLLLPEPPPGEARVREGRAPGYREDTGTGAVTGTGTRTGVDEEGSPPSISVPRKPPPSAPPDPAGVSVVGTWGKQWVKHSPETDSGEWLERLRPYTTAEFSTVLATVNPANVAATKVTGEPEATTSTATSMQVRLPTDAGALRVRVVKTPDGWRVAGYEKAA